MSKNHITQYSEIKFGSETFPTKNIVLETYSEMIDREFYYVAHLLFQKPNGDLVSVSEKSLSRTSFIHAILGLMELPYMYALEFDAKNNEIISLLAKASGE